MGGGTLECRVNSDGAHQHHTSKQLFSLSRLLLSKGGKKNEENL